MSTTAHDVATVRMSARGVTARQARATFTEEHPQFTVIALKKSKGEWLAFMQKKAFGDNDTMNKDMPMGPPTGPPKPGKGPMGLDDIVDDMDSDVKGGLGKIKDLLSQLQSAIDELSDGGPDEDEGDLDDDLPPLHDETHEVNGPKKDLPLPTSHLLERPKEAGLTRRKAAAEIRQMINSDPQYRDYKLTRIVEGKSTYKALLKRV